MLYMLSSVVSVITSICFLFIKTAQWERQTVSDWQDVFTALLTSWQSRAAKCGLKHTEPHSLCLPGSVHSPLLFVLLSSSVDRLRQPLIPLVLVHQRLKFPRSNRQERNPLCPLGWLFFFFLKSGFWGGLVNMSASTVSIYLESRILSEEHSWMLLNGTLQATSEPGRSSEVYGCPVKTWPWFRTSKLISSKQIPCSVSLYPKIAEQLNKLKITL